VKTQLERLVEAGVPRHIALIMDGNGRWAAARGMARSAGHRAGADAAERLIRFAGEQLGIDYLTLYAFSTENWSRPEAEVSDLMELLRHFIEDKTDEFVHAGVRLRVLGDIDGLPAPLAETVRGAIRRTAVGEKLQLAIALNYGSRQEIVRACQRLAAELAADRLEPSAIDEDVFAGFLDTAGIPDPDLVIRTSGEARLSNFLLWQSAYAELFITDTYWPAFTPAELVGILAEYQRRERRFGGVDGEAS